MVVQANSTYAKIETAVRYYTASASQQALPSSTIQEAVNWFYSNDFAYGVKVDQMRSVYTFFTQPYIDRYPLDVNYNQGVREPVYIEGVRGTFSKDRGEYFNTWPKWPTLFNNLIVGDGSTTVYNFTIPAPFLSREVVIGTVDINGKAVSINDDGNGNLNMQIPNAVLTVPAPITNVYPPAAPIPGMLNQNTGNPGLNALYQVGNVNYVTGQVYLNFAVAPAADATITIWVSQYQPGRPYSLLFWNNEFHVRPIPKYIHKVEVETYLTPVQFMQTTDQPILSQWCDLIALGAAIRILSYRQDMDGVENLAKLYDRQQGLALERQGVEEIGSRNATIYSSSQPGNQTIGVNGIGFWT